ncbi:PucR family transcriptional regulator [Rhodococcus rhodochrous]|uniref:PucR family transcriptional regulator n=1 Tax=Rhodococcus rhodochrous TaxID=1829 RepID=UPI0011AE20F2|nr:helix-turn-helix domain-containing protein [Rhodococcus rhodochrous]
MSHVSWGPVVDAVNSALERLEAITDDAVARIRNELADFALVPYPEHRAAVREQLRRRLVAFSERRAWNHDDLDEARALARRRARQGIALDVVIRAYHVGDRELWRNLSGAPGEAQALLPELASLMLESLQAVTSTLALAHGSETRARDRVQMAVSQRLIDLLNAPTLDAEAHRLAAYLGFDVDQTFVGLAYTTVRPDSQNTAEPDLHFLNGPIIVHGGVGSVRVLLAQTDDQSIGQIVDALTTAAFRVGVGSNHNGVLGASRSLRQAQLALSATSHHSPVSRFREDWVTNCVMSRADLLDQEILRIAEIAGAHPSLRDTVVAFSESDMSITGCARTNHLHTNTVVYRLSRWRDLTGLDPRTFPGLMQSVVACALTDVLTNSSGVEGSTIDSRWL